MLKTTNNTGENNLDHSRLQVVMFTMVSIFRQMIDQSLLMIFQKYQTNIGSPVNDKEIFGVI